MHAKELTYFDTNGFRVGGLLRLCRQSRLCSQRPLQHHLALSLFLASLKEICNNSYLVPIQFSILSFNLLLQLLCSSSRSSSGTINSKKIIGTMHMDRNSQCKNEHPGQDFEYSWVKVRSNDPGSCN